MWWELGCPCFRSRGGGLCSSNQRKGASVVTLQSRIENFYWSWYWAMVVQTHGSCGSSARVMLEGWVLVGPCRYRPELFSVSWEGETKAWSTVLPSQAAGVAVPQVRETLKLRECQAPVAELVPKAAVASLPQSTAGKEWVVTVRCSNHLHWMGREG